MKRFLEKIEVFVDKLIPYLILLLIVVVVIDVFFKQTAASYHTELYVTDSVIITFFVIDLIFKYRRVHNIPKFLKLYWLDILAVFPFLLMLRVFEEILLISEGSVSTLRNLFHAGLVLEEEVTAETKLTRAVKSSELIAKEGRVGLVAKWFRPIRRLPRLLKAVSFYEHPKQKKTLYHS